MPEATEEVTVVDRSKWMDTNNGVTKITPEVVVETTVAPVVEVAPVTETTTTTEVVAPVTTTAPSQFEDVWKKEFGDTDVNSVKEILTKYNTIAPEYETLKSAPPVPTYKTEGGKQIDEWLAKGVKLETIARFSNVKPEEVNGEQAIKLKMEIENPSWTPDIINAYYQTTYNHTPNDLLSEEENALQENLKKGAMLKAESESKAYLTEYLGKQFNPSEVVDATAKQREEALVQASQFWGAQAPVLSNAVKQISQELSFKVMGEKGEEEVKLPVNFIVPENDLKQLTDFALQSATRSGVELTEKGLQEVKAYTQQLIWAKFGESIVRSAVQDALSKQQESFAKAIHNPTVATTSSANKGVTDARQQAWRAKLNEQGSN